MPESKDRYDATDFLRSRIIPRVEHQYWTYIMASLSGTLYIGMTSNLDERVWQHKAGIF